MNCADLKSCSEKHEKLEVCFKNKDGYTNPFPVVLSTDLYLVEIIEIDLDKNSIRIQMDLWTIWIDPGLSLSNESAT